MVLTPEVYFVMIASAGLCWFCDSWGVFCPQVKVQCGKDNQLLSVYEPNRCEYEFQFMTPTACSQGSSATDELHDEL